MINRVNISKRVLDEILSKDITRITNLTEEETSIVDQILNLLNDIFTIDSYQIDNDTALGPVDNIDMYNTDIDFTSCTLGYMRKVVDFARPSIAFTTPQPRSNAHARKRPFTDFVYDLIQ